MKIMLQHIADRQIYAGGGLWTATPENGLFFDSTDDAIQFALSERLAGVHILIHLDSAHMDIVIPSSPAVAISKPCEV